MDKQIFKVITPIEKRGGGHYWMKVGSAYRNKDNSINVYLDAIPKGPNLQFQLRELDEEDLRRREAYASSHPSPSSSSSSSSSSPSTQDSIPF